MAHASGGAAMSKTLSSEPTNVGLVCMGASPGACLKMTWNANAGAGCQCVELSSHLAWAAKLYKYSNRLTTSTNAPASMSRPFLSVFGGHVPTLNACKLLSFLRIAHFIPFSCTLKNTSTPWTLTILVVVLLAGGGGPAYIPV